MAGLTEDLELNIVPALSAVDDLVSALSAATQQFGDDLATQIQASLSGIDASPIAAAISEATTSADTTVALQADGSAVTDEGTAAVEAIDPTVVLQADTSQLEAEGAAALQAVNEQATSNVALGIGDTSGVVARGPSAAGETGQAVAELGAAEAATKGLETAQAGLEGNVRGVTSALGPWGAAMGTAAASAGVFYTEAVAAETAQQRLITVFGASKDAIESVQLPANNFNQTLQQIAQATGASLPGLEAANAHIGDLGHSAGATNAQITETAHQITAIASYLAVTNPALGSADQVVNTLTASLARGGRALGQFGLAIPTAEIMTRAEQDTGKLASQLTVYDKAAAGAAITSEQLGTSLGAAYTKGQNAAALALPKLTETLKETVAQVGTPLIGPIISTLQSLEPVLAALATTIGTVLGGAIPSVSTAFQILSPILTTILGLLRSLQPVIGPLVAGFLALQAINLAGTLAGWTSGLLSLGAAATEDVGAVGLLTGAVGNLVASLGPFGVAIGAIVALSVVSKAAAADNASEASRFATSVAGLKSNADLATESASQLQAQLDAVNAKAAEIRKANPSGSSLVPTTVTVDGTTQILDYTDAQKALTDQATKLKTALDTAKSSTDGLSGSLATGGLSAQQFGTQIDDARFKLDGVKVAIVAVETENAKLVSQATGQLVGVSTAFGDTSQAIDAAAKAADKAATSTTSASSAAATAATHAKDLRDAEAALVTTETALATLRAGPTGEVVAAGLLGIEAAAKTTRDALQKVVDTKLALDTLAAGPGAEQLEAGLLADAQAARTTQSATQAVIDAKAALDLLAAGPTATTEAQLRENVAKAATNQEKATLALSDATAYQTAVDALSYATARQREDAAIKTTEAEYALTDAKTASGAAEAALKKATDDSLPGSRAMQDATLKLADARLAERAATDAQEKAQQTQAAAITDSLAGSAAMTRATNAYSDAQLSLAQAQANQEKQQDAQNKLFSDALPGSVAYQNALKAVADAHDHLASVQASGATTAAKAAASQQATSVNVLADLGKNLDEQIARENKFYTDLQTLQAAGDTAIVAELLAQGPTKGAAEASAIVTATATTRQALETKTERLKADEKQHAKDIATIFGQSLNQNLLDQFATQLADETAFYANVQKIFDSGNAAIAQVLLAQGPAQGAALAGALATATPIFLAQLNTEQAKINAAAVKAGADTSASYAAGMIAAISSTFVTSSIRSAFQDAGATAHAGAQAGIQAKSPSILAQQLGLDYAQGLVLGLTGGVPLVASAALQLANAMVVAPPASGAGGLTVGQGGTTTAVTGGANVTQHVTVNQVAQDPTATAFAVSSRIAQQAMR